MENLQRALVLLPLMVWVVQGIKQIIPEKFLWILNSILGIGLAFGYTQAMVITNAMIVLWGITLWLAASWLYETIRDLNKTVK